MVMREVWATLISGGYLVSEAPRGPIGGASPSWAPGDFGGDGPKRHTTFFGDMDEQAHRQRIEARIRELESLLEAGADDSRPVELDQSRVGRLSRMDAMQAQAMSRETERRRRIEVMRLRAALGRLDDGSYGECLECGEPIADKRLEHDPGATVCIECARSVERR
jgi:DnaK suppressor protein